MPCCRSLMRSLSGMIALIALSLPSSSWAVEATILDRLEARNIGPANMGGRIVEVAVVESNPKTMYVAAATGGLWKTTDGGTTWTPVFDGQDTLSLGAVTVAPGDPDIVWVGTGEANPRNSVSWGNGVYKSTDGGKTWKHMGLRENQHVGRIAIHPRNPDVVLVAALGRVWGPSKERGIYRTGDGGKTWQRVKFLDEDTGFIDVAIDPVAPDVMYAASYSVRRDAFSGGSPRRQWGPNGGLFRSTDGGLTWQKMTNGLPGRPYGRSGLAIYRKDPRIVYAIIQTDQTAGHLDNRGQLPRTHFAAIDRGGIFRSDDRGTTWRKLNDLVPRPFYYGQIRIDPNDDRRIYVLGVQLFISNDGGLTFATGGRNVHPDHHALWINPKDSNHLVLGNDGGLYFSTNRARTFTPIRGMAIGQFYGVAVDMSKPYWVYGGLQDNGTWGGPSASDRPEGITLADWRQVGGGDGFQAVVDPTDPYTIYIERQYGNLSRLDLRKGRAVNIKPRAPQGLYRYNWNTPLVLSPHDPKTIYYGANILFRSTTRGDTWEKISPDLTSRTKDQPPVTGNTLTTIAESPVKAGLLWVGSDDGKLHVSRDGGTTWTDLSEKLPGIPAQRWITRVECSHFAEGTTYVTIDRHRNDDRRPYVYRTTDLGDTWVSLVSNLPKDAPVHVMRESSKNRDLLFVGTEFGLFVSLDAGKIWHRLKRGIPPGVTVHGLVIHPRDRDLVIGTHGRSVYILDIAPLEELTAKAREQVCHLGTIKPARLRKPRAAENPAEPKAFVGTNPPDGAVIWYHLKESARDDAQLSVTDADGKEIARFTGPARAGLNRVVWNLRPTGDRGAAAPGKYKVTLVVAGQSLARPLVIEDK